MQIDNKSWEHLLADGIVICMSDIEGPYMARTWTFVLMQIFGGHLQPSQLYKGFMWLSLEKNIYTIAI